MRSAAPTIPEPSESVCARERDGECPTTQLTALVRAQRLRLLSLARRRGLAGEEAFDCVQDAFATFLRHPRAADLLGRPDEAARMLTTIVLNGSHTRRRAVARSARRTDDAAPDTLTDESDAGPDVAAERTEGRAQLRLCMLALSDVQRAVVTLRMLEDLPGPDVARTLGLSPENVAVLLHRARASLRGCMTAAGHCAGG